MFYLINLIFALIFLFHSFLRLKDLDGKFSRQYAALCEKQKSFNSINSALSKRFQEMEDKINDAFFVYELARDMSPLISQKKLLDVFESKLKEFGGIKSVIFSNRPREKHLNYELKTYRPRYISIGSSSRKTREYLPLFLHQLNLCLERIDLYKKLQELSIHDSLTQIYNRRYFMERFYEEFERAKKFSLPLSFLMVDIDYFKKINDTYGHIVGDVVLREIARILKDSIRTIDFVARMGGEEFAVILTETNKKNTLAVAKRIVKEIASSKLKAFDETLKVTISIGAASYPENTADSDMLIEVADKALYQAKESGRNRVSWF
ncbi:MAG: GGDEF domain-containing protein [Candidatus Omnitrophota bacterium]